MIGRISKIENICWKIFSGKTNFFTTLKLLVEVVKALSFISTKGDWSMEIESEVDMKDCFFWELENACASKNENKTKVARNNLKINLVVNVLCFRMQFIIDLQN
jgi:hypothetical protein